MRLATILCGALLCGACSKTSSQLDGTAPPGTAPEMQLPELKQLGFEPVAHLTPAVSRADRPSKRATAIALSRKDILLENSSVAKLTCMTQAGEPCGREDRAQEGNRYSVGVEYKPDAAAASYVIEPLSEAVKQHLAQEKARAKRRPMRSMLVINMPEQRRSLVLNSPWSDNYMTAAILCDRDLPFRVITETIHSVGMAGIHAVRFLVVDPSKQHLRALPVTMPQIGRARPRPEGEAAPPPPLFPTVLVGRDRIIFRGSTKRSSEAKSLFEPLAREAQGIPYHLLYGRVRAIAKRFPDESLIHIGADEGVRWQELVDVFDAAYLRLEQDEYPTLEAYRAAKLHPEKPHSFDYISFVVEE